MESDNEAPSFLDNEALLDNLTDSQAVRVIDWLIKVYKKKSQEINVALQLAKEINQMFNPLKMIDKKAHFQTIKSLTDNASILEIGDTDENVFEKIMTKLEEKYARESSQIKQ
ncbi:MAG TPA: hypothetical protein PLI45_01075 [Candidatus Woesebacteria bacterium]|nr:hypothetical protein [Candidatus Woesebacteria bacterium]